MIIVKLMGGLGNQMFQYALGRRLAAHHKTDLKLDLGWFKTQALRTYGLDAFKIEAGVASSDDVDEVTGAGLGGVRGALDRFIQRRIPYYRRRVVVEKSPLFDSRLIEKGESSAYLIGYWQSEKYFKDIEIELRQELTCSLPNRINEGVLQRISESNSISLHVRRGDYVSNPVANQILGACSREYYQQCIWALVNEIHEPHFFVFSDDMEWARANLEFEDPVEFVEHYAPQKDHEDFCLMKACKHHIIANSSFSWWAAWLGSFPQKKVWAPRQWFKDMSIQAPDLIPEAWTQI